MLKTIAEDYLQGRNGSIQEYHLGLARRLRLGQAFFNALSEKDQQLLRGTLRDPFHKNTSQAIEEAVVFLLDQY